jgi:hypothetical protein
VPFVQIAHRWNQADGAALAPFLARLAEIFQCGDETHAAILYESASDARQRWRTSLATECRKNRARCDGILPPHRLMDWLMDWFAPLWRRGRCDWLGAGVARQVPGSY